MFIILCKYRYYCLLYKTLQPRYWHFLYSYTRGTSVMRWFAPISAMCVKALSLIWASYSYSSRTICKLFFLSLIPQNLWRKDPLSHVPLAFGSLYSVLSDRKISEWKLARLTSAIFRAKCLENGIQWVIFVTNLQEDDRRMCVALYVENSDLKWRTQKLKLLSLWFWCTSGSPKTREWHQSASKYLS